MRREHISGSFNSNQNEKILPIADYISIILLTFTSPIWEHVFLIMIIVI